MWLGAWDPEFCIGTTSSSSGQPSPSHHWYGGLTVKRPAQKETKQDPKIGMLRDNRSDAHFSHKCSGSTYLPPPLELVVQSEARSTAHRLWSLACWSYPHPNRGHSSILRWLQQSDPIFNML